MNRAAVVLGVVAITAMACSCARQALGHLQLTRYPAGFGSSGFFFATINERPTERK